MYTWNTFNIQISDPTMAIQTTCCPKCHNKKLKTTETLQIDLAEQSWFCFHCGYAGTLFEGEQKLVYDEVATKPWSLNPLLHGIQNPPKKLSPTILKTFADKGITETTLLHFKIHTSRHYFPSTGEFSSCLCYPYTKNQLIYNNVYFYGKHKTFDIGGVPICFNYDGIQTEEIYIVMDEMEVFSFYEAGIKNAISLFGGYQTNDYNIDTLEAKLLECLTNIESNIEQVKKIIIAMPNTLLGNRIKEEILRRLGREKCWVIELAEKDSTFNDLLINYGKDKFIVLAKNAKAIPIRGIFEIEDVEEHLEHIYRHGLRKGASTGFSTLDKFYTILPGQWTVITGIPGHGKSNLLDQILVNLANNEEWKFGIFSPEHQPIARHFASIMEKYYSKPFDIGNYNRITEEELVNGKKWLKRHFSIILPHEDDSWTIDGVLSLAKILVYRKGIKGLVIDPWNEIEHSRPNNQTETEYVSTVLTKIRKFARKYDTHVWLVAHPAKLYKDKDGKYPVPTPYDISGSAHYRNKADNCITIWRNVGGADQSVADIHIQKIKLKEVGQVGLASLRFDVVTNSYIDDIDQDRRVKALENGDIVSTERLRKSFY